MKLTELPRIMPKKCAPLADHELDAYYRREDYIAQRKYDGIRYMLQYNPNGTIWLYSRTISKQAKVIALNGGWVHKEANLPHLVEFVRDTFKPGIILDGEVVVNGGACRSRHVTPITGALPDVAIALQRHQGFAQYMVWDCLAYEGHVTTDWPLYQRLDLLETLKIPPGPIIVTPTIAAYEAKLMVREAVLSSGGEGMILKRVESRYDSKRNKEWVKDKPMREYDVVFMGITDARQESKKVTGIVSTTKFIGLAGSIRFGQYIDGKLKEIGQCSGFDDATRRDVTEHVVEYCGRVFTVRAQLREPDSQALLIPQFDRWRDDKAAEDCIYDPNEA